MRPRSSLLEAVRGLIERTYRLRTGLEDLGSFVIGDAGYRRLYDDSGVAPSQAGYGGALGARTLVRETDSGVRACIYFPDSMIRRLEAFPPTRGLGDENVEAFAAFVEEIDHLLLLADRSRRRSTVSLFEMELQANVSKRLVLARFLARRVPRLDARRRHWLQYHLFHRGCFSDPDPHVRRRYQDAARWAWRFLRQLERMQPGDRIAMLRKFYHLGHGAKVELISRLARG